MLKNVSRTPGMKKLIFDEEAMMLTRMILNALQLSNFALNFFLYCTLNAQFRRAFVDWLCRRRASGRHRRDARRAALGPDAERRGGGGGALGAPPRRNYEVVRLNAGVRHPPRHDDVTAELLPVTFRCATFRTILGHNRKSETYWSPLLPVSTTFGFIYFRF